MTKKWMVRAAVGVVAGGVGVLGTVVPAHASYTQWCEGGDLHVRDSNGGTGVVYNSSQCR